MAVTQIRDEDRKLSIAPMMDWTDRFDRYFLRLISKRVLLYTEMVTTGAVIHGDRQKLLGFHEAEHPVACQLGGSDPAELKLAAKVVEDFGYDEVNLNVGCPSDRVQSGRFGACLMADPQLVADCVAAMREVVDIPVTVKHRIGIDDQDSYESMKAFVDTVADAGCRHFIVHARIAILQGLSPKENRDIPPLKYDFAHRLKQERPDLHISINGGIKTLDETEDHLKKVDGVMIGRAAYQTPYILAEADRRIYGDDTGRPNSRHDILRAFLPYVREELAAGTSLNHITRHLMGLFAGCPGGAKYRRYLSENAYHKGADERVIEEAMALVPENTQAAPRAG